MVVKHREAKPCLLIRNGACVYQKLGASVKLQKLLFLFSPITGGNHLMTTSFTAFDCFLDAEALTI
jgi:hypothetical protein